MLTNGPTVPFSDTLHHKATAEVVQSYVAGVPTVGIEITCHQSMHGSKNAATRSLTLTTEAARELAKSLIDAIATI